MTPGGGSGNDDSAHVRLPDLIDFEKVGIWKVGAGDGQRAFPEIVREFDTFAAGPGEPGPYSSGHPYLFNGRVEHQIRHLYEDVKPDDIFILRVGASKVESIGVVRDDHPTFDEAWGDVDGWNVRHTRRVKWLTGPRSEFGRVGFGAQGATLASVKHPHVLERLREVRVSPKALKAPLKPKPEAGQPLGIEEAADVASAPTRLVNTLQETVRQANCYREKGYVGAVSEHETLAYMAVPILLSLGWTKEQCALEFPGKGGRTDAVLFQGTRTPQNVWAVVEAKRFGRSLRRAAIQGQEYVRENAYPNCRFVFATDGPRWAISEQLEPGYWELVAYLNLERPRDRYPVLGPKVMGAREALKRLMPNS